jgi:hypothetical protein
MTNYRLSSNGSAAMRIKASGIKRTPDPQIRSL